jgi:Ca2+-binding EF-hand superfamily protein
MKDAFKRFDFNGDNLLSFDEFKKAFQIMKLDYTDAEIRMIVKYIDKTGDNQINVKEFMAALNL